MVPRGSMKLDQMHGLIRSYEVRPFPSIELNFFHDTFEAERLSLSYLDLDGPKDKYVMCCNVEQIHPGL